jgi:heptosyltransferase-2
MSKILVVGPSWVGDMVMAQSLFKRLHQRHPGCSIDVLAPEWSHPILQRMPEVNQALELPLGHGQLGLKTRWQLGKSLARRGYTQAIVLPRSWKSALVPFAAGIPQRTGFLGEQRYFLLNDRRPLNKQDLDQTVKRFVALGLAKGEQPDWGDVASIPQPQLTVDPINQQRLVAELGLDLSRPAVALMPGAEYGPAKQWPLDSFRELAQQLVQQGRQVWVLGSAKDQAAGQHIAQGQEGGAGQSGFVFNLCGRTQLADTVDLLALAKQAVTNDSGLMHVAAAVGTQVHAIYGSSSPRYTPPLTANKVVHYLGLECSPCFKRTCPLGHLDCLRGIKPGDIAPGPGGPL